MKMIMSCLTGEEFCGRPIKNEKEVDLEKISIWELVSIGCGIPVSVFYGAFRSTDGEWADNQDRKNIRDLYYYVRERLLSESDDELVWALKRNRPYGYSPELHPFYNLISAEYCRRMVKFQ